MNEFLKMIAELLETDEILTADTEYDTLENWDSLTLMSLLATINIDYNKTVHMVDFKETKTLGDIYAVIQKAPEDK